MRKLVLLFILGFVRPALGLTDGDLSAVRFEQHPGAQISPSLTFRDENNRLFRLGDHFGKQPTVLVLGYYRCPMLCSFINDGVIETLQDLRFTAGRDFQVLNVSIDPSEDAHDAAAKKSQNLRRYGRPGAAEGWHCLVGDAPSIAELANAVGYRYAYDPGTRQFAHPSGIVVLTPDGKISRYLFGVKFDATELRDALVAARDGKSSSIISQVLLLCYHYNPITGKYGGLVLSILRIGGVATVLGLIGMVLAMAARDRRSRRFAAVSSKSAARPAPLSGAPYP